MPTDKKYVSAEQHEITTVAALFQDQHNGNVSPDLIYSLRAHFVHNKNKCLRSELYQVLELMGYTKRVKE